MTHRKQRRADLPPEAFLLCTSEDVAWLKHALVTL